MVDDKIKEEVMDAGYLDTDPDLWTIMQEQNESLDGNQGDEEQPSAENKYKIYYMKEENCVETHLQDEDQTSSVSEKRKHLQTNINQEPDKKVCRKKRTSHLTKEEGFQEQQLEETDESEIYYLKEGDLSGACHQEEHHESLGENHHIQEQQAEKNSGYEIFYIKKEEPLEPCLQEDTSGMNATTQSSINLEKPIFKTHTDVTAGMRQKLSSKIPRLRRPSKSTAKPVPLKKPVFKTRTEVNSELRQKLRRSSKIPRLRRPSLSTFMLVPAEDQSKATPTKDPPVPSLAADPPEPDSAGVTFSDVSMDISYKIDSEDTIIVQRDEPTRSAFQPVVQCLPTWPHPQQLDYSAIPHRLVDELRRLGEATMTLQQQNHTLQQQNQALLYEFAELRKEVREMKSQQPEKTSPKYSPLGDDQVLIGSADASLIIGREEYLRAWETSSDAKDLILRLMSILFTREELAQSNFNGGDIFNGKEKRKKRGLREDPRFKVLIGQAEVQFPGSLTTDQQRRQLRDAVNNKCRKSAQIMKVIKRQ